MQENPSEKTSEEMVKATNVSETHHETPVNYILRQRIGTLNNSQPLNIDFNNEAALLDEILSNPQHVDFHLLENYIKNLIQVMANQTFRSDFLDYLDKITLLFAKSNRPTTHLYLAKAQYYARLTIEGDTRKAALDQAMAYAETLPEMLDTLCNIGQYYNDTSQYNKSIETFVECEAFANSHLVLRKFFPQIWGWRGATHFVMFQYDKARLYLEKSCKATDEHPDNRNMANSLHYLGRVAEAEGNLKAALEFYIKGQNYQQLCQTEPASDSFIHLRLAQLLISARLLDQARDHLSISQDLSNQVFFTSSLRAQIDLTWADYYAATGTSDDYEKNILEALNRAKTRNYPRGELLCLVKLFWFQVMHLKLFSAVKTFRQAMRTGNNSELSRSGRISTILKYVFRILPAQLFTKKIMPTTCTCSIHSESL